MLKISFWLGLSLLLFIPQAFADLNKAEAVKFETRTVSPLLFRELVPGLVAVKALKVIDPVTFIGEDKTVYALSGIEVPDFGNSIKDASTKLAAMIEGKELKTYLTKNRDLGRTNRMNQSIVQAELKQDHIWIEGEMLASGLARVKTTQSNPELSGAMYEIEDQARKNKKGIWKDNPVLTPDTADNHDNSFQIVEGAPKSAAITRNMIYLNYGDDYKTDFTVAIPTTARMGFAKRGIDPLKFAHVTLRVRGWMRTYNGPFMEIDHPEQVEILGRMPIGPALSEAPEPSPNNAGMRTIAQPKKPVAEAPKAPEIEKPVKKEHVSEPNP